VAGQLTSRQPLKRSSQSSSNLAREIFSEKSSPSRRASTSIVVEVTDESVRLARSHWLRNRRMARAEVVMSLPVFFCHRSLRKSRRRWSKSSPPRWVSPAVALTVKTPPSIVRSDTSKVPPPSCMGRGRVKSATARARQRHSVAQKRCVGDVRCGSTRRGCAHIEDKNSALANCASLALALLVCLLLAQPVCDRSLLWGEKVGE
jgi:hypothetical protein